MITRRRFLKSSAAATAAVGMPKLAASQVLGANDQITVGVLGLGTRGRRVHMRLMEEQPGVRVVAVCDVDRKRMGTAAERFEADFGRKVDQYVDMRQMFDRQDIDVISNATQSYWHGLSTIWACQAGKHVYCEKPLSHYVWEGRQMVKAARKYDRIVQTGTQNRSHRQVIAAIKWVQDGHLGKINYITAFNNNVRGSVGKRDTPLPIPDYIDYDLWCGPAKKLPIYRNRLQYDCHFDWNTGGGELANQGVHEVDAARWCLREPGLPRGVMSIGGRFVVDDAGNVPNTLITYWDFPTAPVLYEHHDPALANGGAPTFRGVAKGMCVHCEGGYLTIDESPRKTGIAYDSQGRKMTSFRFSEGEEILDGSSAHFENFIAAVRAGRRDLLRADVLEGHLSTTACNAGAISYRVGRQVDQYEIRKQVEQIPIFNEMFDRFLHYGRGLEIDLQSKSATLGPWLEIDRENECFKDHNEANVLVRGFYRDPYMIPDPV